MKTFAFALLLALAVPARAGVTTSLPTAPASKVAPAAPAAPSQEDAKNAAKKALTALQAFEAEQLPRFGAQVCGGGVVQLDTQVSMRSGMALVSMRCVKDAGAATLLAAYDREANSWAPVDLFIEVDIAGMLKK